MIILSFLGLKSGFDTVVNALNCCFATSNKSRRVIKEYSLSYFKCINSLQELPLSSLRCKNIIKHCSNYIASDVEIKAFQFFEMTVELYSLAKLFSTGNDGQHFIEVTF